MFSNIVIMLLKIDLLSILSNMLPTISKYNHNAAEHSFLLVYGGLIDIVTALIRLPLKCKTKHKL